MKKHFVTLAFLIAFGLLGTTYLFSKETKSAPQKGRTTLSVYTTGMATTPQIPFWKAIKDGTLPVTPTIHYWKNPDDLRTAILAGKGDIWIGHTEGFAQAAMRGAPVQLISITGWKKFHIVTSRKDLKTFADLKHLPETTQIAAAPPHSPGVAMLKALEEKGFPTLQYTHHEPKELALKAADNTLELMILPEPLVTILLTKNSKLHVVANVEEEFGRMQGTGPFLPIAGIAINTNTLKKHPTLAGEIQQALAAQEDTLRNNPLSGIAALPHEFEKFIPKSLVKASLKRDIIRIRSASTIEPLIREYLRTVLPNAIANDGRLSLPQSFFGTFK